MHKIEERELFPAILRTIKVGMLDAGGDVVPKATVSAIRNELHQLSKLPMVVVPDRFINNHEVVDGEGERFVSKFFTLGLNCIGRPFFNNCIYTLLYEEESDDGGPDFCSRLWLHIDIDSMEGSVFWVDEKSDLPELIRWLPFTLYGAKESGFMALWDPKKTRENPIQMATSVGVKQLVLSSWGGYDEKDKRNPVKAYVEYKFSNLLIRLGMLHASDYYPIQKTTTRKKRKRGSGISGRSKQVKEGNIGPKVIYINNFSDITGRQGESKSTVSPHQRRGCWCTLSADRFMNHPLYKKHKAFYRRPTWVGPEVMEYEGNTYKVLMLSEDKEE